MFETIKKLYNKEALEAHRKGEELKFLSISEVDFIELEKEFTKYNVFKSDPIKKPKFFGLRILRTEDLESGEFIFH